MSSPGWLDLRRAATLLRLPLLGPTLGAALTVLAGCSALQPDPGPPPAKLVDAVVLHLPPGGLEQVARHLLAKPSDLGAVPVEVAESFLPLPEGGTVTYGPQTWSFPIELSELRPLDERLELSLAVTGPRHTELTLLVRPRLGTLRRCVLGLDWGTLRLDLSLAPAAGEQGEPALAARSRTLGLAAPSSSLDAGCAGLLAEAEQRQLATVAEQAVRRALELQADRTAAALGRALGLESSLRGLAETGPPADGSYAIDLRVGEALGLDPHQRATVDPQGWTLPLQLGVATRQAGRCSPPAITELPAPPAPPTFAPPAADTPEAEQLATVALSAQGLGRLVAAVLEAGAPCQPLDGRSSTELQAAAVAQYLPLDTLAAADAPLTALLRPGEPPSVELIPARGTVRLGLRRLALDLYVQVDGVDLRVLAATADLVVELTPRQLAGSEAASGLWLVPSALEVVPRWVSSELLTEANGALANALPPLYSQLIGPLLTEQLRLPAPALAGLPLRLISSRADPSYLFLSFVTRVD